MTTRRQEEARERAQARARKRKLAAAITRELRDTEDRLLEAAIAAGQRVPTPQRITLALDLRGLYGPQVDADLGVLETPPTVVDDWEAGTRVPTLEEVKRLADLTGFEWRFFYLPAPPDFAGPVFICGRGATVSVHDQRREAARARLVDDDQLELGLDLR